MKHPKIASQIWDKKYRFKMASVVDQDFAELETRVLAAHPPHQCKDCWSYNLKKEAGCEVCGDCGSSKCG